MDNQEFRNLLINNATESRSKSNGSQASKPEAPSALGSRNRSFMPMTPRSVAGHSSSNEFARQLAARSAAERPAKKFKSSAAPKGVKLAPGYRDRTKDRETDAYQDDKEARIKALEDAVKLGQLEPEAFIQLRDAIVGGDTSSTHLVKGLDYKLLDRVRRGEDVFSEATNSKASNEPNKETLGQAEVDFEEELDQLEDAPVVPITREKHEKKGEMAAPAMAGRKRTRDEILADLKAARRAATAEAAAATQPQLGPKFKKVGGKQKKTRIERDEHGREILITVDENGKIKRKVRKSDLEKSKANKDGQKRGLLMPDKNAEVLGSDVVVPALPPPREEESDDDIFGGVGADYNPLGNVSSDDSDSDSRSDDGSETKSEKPKAAKPSPTTNEVKKPEPKPTEDVRRNYFGGISEKQEPAASELLKNTNPLKDPSFLSSISKASAIAAKSKTSEPNPLDKEAAAKAARRAAMLSGHDRDEDDLDMGFGSSRFEDGEEAAAGDERVKLGVWRGTGDDMDQSEAKGGDRSGKGPRKRGPKKKKGDKNSAKDVLNVMQQRKKGK